MIKPKRIFFTPHTPDLNGIAVNQQIGGAGNLTLDGVDVGLDGVARFVVDGEYGKVAYKVSLESLGNLSGVNFTITGTDAQGDPLVEALVGPNVSTVQSLGYFRTVSQVAVDGAVATDVQVGTVDEFVTGALILDLYSPYTSIAVDISGTIDYSVQKCFERLTAGQSPNWLAGGLTTQVADGQTAYTQATGAIRLLGNSFTGGATVGMNIAQANP